MDRRLIWVAVAGFILVTLFTVVRREYYSEDNPIINEIRKRFRVIKPEYFQIPVRSGNKSYTENKKAITLCIKDPETGEYYDMNTLMYVALHELAHCITKADGDHSHGDEFKMNFSKLLKEAHIKKVYDSSKPIPITYCGVGHDD